jgi:hypothetical protein
MLHLPPCETTTYFSFFELLIKIMSTGESGSFEQRTCVQNNYGMERLLAIGLISYCLPGFGVLLV